MPNMSAHEQLTIKLLGQYQGLFQRVEYQLTNYPHLQESYKQILELKNSIQNISNLTQLKAMIGQLESNIQEIDQFNLKKENLQSIIETIDLLFRIQPDFQTHNSSILNEFRSVYSEFEHTSDWKKQDELIERMMELFKHLDDKTIHFRTQHQHNQQIFSDPLYMSLGYLVPLKPMLDSETLAVLRSYEALSHAEDAFKQFEQANDELTDARMNEFMTLSKTIQMHHQKLLSTAQQAPLLKPLGDLHSSKMQKLNLKDLRAQLQKLNELKKSAPDTIELTDMMTYFFQQIDLFEWQLERKKKISDDLSVHRLDCLASIYTTVFDQQETNQRCCEAYKKTCSEAMKKEPMLILLDQCYPLKKYFSPKYQLMLTQFSTLIELIRDLDQNTITTNSEILTAHWNKLSQLQNELCQSSRLEEIRVEFENLSKEIQQLQGHRERIALSITNFLAFKDQFDPILFIELFNQDEFKHIKDEILLLKMLIEHHPQVLASIPQEHQRTFDDFCKEPPAASMIGALRKTMSRILSPLNKTEEFSLENIQTLNQSLDKLQILKLDDYFMAIHAKFEERIKLSDALKETVQQQQKKLTQLYQRKDESLSVQIQELFASAPKTDLDPCLEDMKKKLNDFLMEQNKLDPTYHHLRGEIDSLLKQNILQHVPCEHLFQKIGDLEQLIKIQENEAKQAKHHLMSFRYGLEQDTHKHQLDQSYQDTINQMQSLIQKTDQLMSQLNLIPAEHPQYGHLNKTCSTAKQTIQLHLNNLCIQRTALDTLSLSEPNFQDILQRQRKYLAEKKESCLIQDKEIEKLKKVIEEIEKNYERREQEIKKYLERSMEALRRLRAINADTGVITFRINCTSETIIQNYINDVQTALSGPNASNKRTYLRAEAEEDLIKSLNAQETWLTALINDIPPNQGARFPHPDFPFATELKKLSHELSKPLSFKSIHAITGHTQRLLPKKIENIESTLDKFEEKLKLLKKHKDFKDKADEFERNFRHPMLDIYGHLFNQIDAKINSLAQKPNKYQREREQLSILKAELKNNKQAYLQEIKSLLSQPLRSQVDQGNQIISKNKDICTSLMRNTLNNLVEHDTRGWLEKLMQSILKTLESAAHASWSFFKKKRPTLDRPLKEIEEINQILKRLDEKLPSGAAFG